MCQLGENILNIQRCEFYDGYEVYLHIPKLDPKRLIRHFSQNVSGDYIVMFVEGDEGQIDLQPMHPEEPCVHIEEDGTIILTGTFIPDGDDHLDGTITPTELSLTDQLGIVAAVKRLLKVNGTQENRPCPTL